MDQAFWEVKVPISHFPIKISILKKQLYNELKQAGILDRALFTFRRLRDC
jgi:hypothetical protein